MRLRRLRWMIALCLLSGPLFGQQSQQAAVFITATTNDSAPVAPLQLSELAEKNSAALHQLRSLGATPIHYAVMVDTSNSQRAALNNEAKIAEVFLRNVVRDGRDSGMLVSFDMESYIEQKLTNHTARLVDALGNLRAQGGSALMDAVAITARRLQVISVADVPNVIFLISDGGDNASRLSRRSVLQEIEKTGVRVYSLFITRGDNFHRRGSEQGNMESLAEVSGGRVFSIDLGKKAVSFDGECKTIRQDLDNWYSLEVAPAFVGREIPIRRKIRQIRILAPQVVPEIVTPKRDSATPVGSNSDPGREPPTH